MNEVPRRQFTGGFAGEVVVENEDGVAEVFEDEVEDGVEPGLEIESMEAGGERSGCLLDCFFLRFVSMTVPKFSAEAFKNRGSKIASGLDEKNK